MTKFLKDYIESDILFVKKTTKYVFVYFLGKKVVTIQWDERNNEHKILDDESFGWKGGEGWTGEGNRRFDVACL